MPKIVSRPEDYVAGSGPYTIRMNLEELEFITALLYVTRLGPDTYQEAAFKLLTSIEELLDEDFPEEAFNDVNPTISVLNDRGDIIEQHHCENISIEV